MIYLDHNATTRPTDTCIAAMEQALRDHWANPSSTHRPGQSVRQQLELARHELATLLHAQDREIIFTSGGSEAANLAIRGSVTAQKRLLVTMKTEHSIVRGTAEQLAEGDIDVAWIAAGEGGVIDLDDLAQTLQQRRDDVALVAVMWANNETGVIQPVAEIAAICHEHGARLFVDGVQWVGKMPTDLAAVPIDLLGFSAHKFHGPKGAGGLFVRRGVRLAAQQIGHQERDRRGGTENIPGILGMAAAASDARAWLATDGPERCQAQRDHFEASILATIDDSRVNGAGSPRLWNTANIAFHRLEAEAILLLLSERGVCASAGAACASGSLDPSPVLVAMGIDPAWAHGSVRFSISRDTTRAEIDAAVEIIAEVIARLRGSMVSA